MRDYRVGHIDARVFFIPCYVVLTALSLYGPVEYFYMAGSCSASVGGALMCLLLNVALNACVILGWVCFIHVVRVTDRLTTYASAASLAVFLGCYASAHALVKLDEVPLIKIPNMMPWLFTGCGSYVPVSPYHIIVFLVGLLSLLTAFTIPATSVYGIRVGARALATYLGAVSVGLTYQDWLWFVTNPSTNPTCGSRYGIYFNQWVCFNSIEIPAIYLLGHVIGLPLMLAPPLATCGRRAATYVLTLLGLMAAVVVLGTTFTLLK